MLGRIAKHGIAVAVVVFVSQHIAANLSDLEEGAFNVDLPGLAFSLVVVSVSGVLGAPILRVLFLAVDVSVPLRSSVVLATVPMLGKYIPGRVHTTIGFIWLASRLEGVSPAISSVTVFFYSVIIVGSSSITGVLFLGAVDSGSPLILPMAALFVVAVAVLATRHSLLPLNLLLRALGRNPIEAIPDRRRLAGAFGLAIAQHLVAVLAFVILVHSLLDVPASLFFQLGGALIVAGLSGVLAFFAPAGLGVQEGTMLLLLSSWMPPEQAAMLAVATRLWQVTMNLAVALLGLLLLPKRAPEDMMN
ncbi:MAG: lysylphosphatidylglycerol synthase domain-containing protein [Deltaproteobacteria bacterium]|nr:lysylphosphatidylglycerol synthase domain-containing protein [Deltaproteobacteria bacterium]